MTMPDLFGRALSKSSLQAYSSDMAQFASVRRATLREGFAEGVDVIDFRTGSGFEFSVLPGRALDIGAAYYNGVPLYWRASPGQVHAAYFEPEDMGWMRGYAGGLLTTGGLSYMGSPSQDAGEDLGIHGRISYAPASNVWADAGWDGDRYRLWARGKVTETAALGTNLIMTREISTELGASYLKISDTVENRTYSTVPHMMLYHFNVGFPILSEESRLLLNVVETIGRDEVSTLALDQWERFEPPAIGRDHQLFYHRPRPDGSGMAHVALVGCAADEPVAVYLSYSHETLPWFANRKCMQSGNYVTGLEPANAWVEGRAVEREAGRLRFLEPWESVAYTVEFGVLAGEAAIDDFAARHGLPDYRS